MDKIHIENGSVQETLIIPLYGRKLCAEQFPTLYQDKYAAKICESIDYDFSQFRSKENSAIYQFGALEGAMREKDINLFSDVKEEFSLFDPKFLEEIRGMKEKNLAVELLKKLIAEQVQIYRRTNVVKSEKFSEIIQGIMNRYLNGMLTNEEVIEELLKMAKQIRDAHEAGDELGLSEDELAFYDALTKPQAIKDFYENDELIAITKELTETLRKNRSVDWQKRDSARAKMRMMIKRLLKKHKYPPEGMDDAVATVMLQCELWTDNNDMEHRVVNYSEVLKESNNQELMMVAEDRGTYDNNKC